MKRIFITIALASLGILSVKADEGMWLPSLISHRITDMQSKGFRLSADDIYDINKASLKDAVVQFGRGCTGELISAEGLLLTNHHCGYSQIQQHSSVEHDYLRDGFWAMTRNEELPNADLSVRFLERMEDVTSVILKGYSPEMDEQTRETIVKKNSKRLIESNADPRNGIKATVEALYYGNQYFLFVYKEFSDVRLVGAPPSSIGKFGGDTDNWMWPRHTGDFSIFRIYADRNNNPASYSKDNVPYKPKKYFTISSKGVKEGDFTFIYGFPGRTQEYIHSEAVRYTENIGDPQKIALRTIRLDIMNRHMSQSQKVRIQYSSKYARVSNAWKKWQGEVKGLKKLKTTAAKQAYEKEFDKWAAENEYKGVLKKLKSLYEELEPYTYATDWYSECVRPIEIADFAMSIARLYRNDGTFDNAKACSLAELFYKDYHMPIDKEIFAAMMQEYASKVPEAFTPEYFRNAISKYGTPQAWAGHIYANTLFADKEEVLGLGPEDRDRVFNDPATVFFNEFLKWYYTDIRPHMQRLDAEVQLVYREYMRGQMEYSKSSPKTSRNFYPDANRTLRVSYGHVKGYSPADGIYYNPSSTMQGIMEKDNPDIFDYNIPQRLRDLYASKDFGKWTDEKGEVPVCFIATNHTTGGNSGSPVINADGELIGINFDRVWEGTMSDIAFDPDKCRNIALDIRYVLFTIDKVAGAGHLVNEMTIK